MDIEDIEQYLRARVDELRSLADRGDPWVFLCASSFIEYLAKMVNGKTTTADDYKDFLRNRFFAECPGYAQFHYDSGQADLADQMYHVLRCGIVHSFSLIADPSAATRGRDRCAATPGRDRSILLGHRKNGATHLQPHVDKQSNPPIDAVVFTAEDFVQDIAKVTDSIIAESKHQTAAGRDLNKNIRKWIAAYPPITGAFPIQSTTATTPKRVTSA